MRGRQLRACRPKKIMPAPTAMAITPAMLGMGMTRCWSAVTLRGPASITTFFSVKEMLSMTRPAMPMAISMMPKMTSGFIAATPCSFAGVMTTKTRAVAISSTWENRDSGPHEHRPSLLDRQPGHRLEAGVGRAADRMADLGKAIIRHAQHPTHQLGGTREPLGHDAKGRNQETFSCYGVVQTAR